MHGFGDHHDFLLMNQMRAYASRFRCLVLGFDMPGHGRSDGLWVHVPDWFEFVQAAEEFVERVARPKCVEHAAAGAPPLKLFVQGVSMGGGVCATMALTRPGNDLFDGMILEAPMLTVR
jgi:alpha-beta hydrolase superfamily lysophospholipase